MPSKLHQSLLLWATRRMEADGFRLVGYDGQSEQGGVRNALPRPFLLAGLRPDAWAVHSASLVFAFAEAKSSHDIDTKHTRRQLQIFSAVKMRNTQIRCPLYIAVPNSSLVILDYVLEDLKLSSNDNIIKLGLPDVRLRAA